MFNIAHPYLSLIASIAVGLLVGMERGWTQRNFGKGRRVAGFRTFGLIGLLGGLGGLAPDMVAAALGLGVAAVLTVGYSRSADQDHLSATTTLAGLLTFGAGFCATRLSPALGLATGAAIFAILSSRQSMHALLRGMDESEIEGVSRFLLVSLVILPLLPDASYGPYDAWNPRKIWMVVVFVMGLSFAGYAISRRFGRDRGVLLVALTGAIVSSTAVTADYARRLRNEPDGRGLLTAGIAVASIVMFVRVQLVALVLVPRALPSLALTMAPAALVAVAFALTAWRAHGKGGNGAAVANPLGFTPALLLAALVAGLSLAARWALVHFGQQGMAVVLTLTGISDVDAAVMTMAGLPQHAIDDQTAGFVLGGAVLANTLAKAVMTVGIGWGHGGLRAAIPLFAALAAAAASLAAWIAIG
ncbi:MgtC/SapB family protein [Sphingobium chungangianum]